MSRKRAGCIRRRRGSRVTCRGGSCGGRRSGRGEGPRRPVRAGEVSVLEVDKSAVGGVICSVADEAIAVVREEISGGVLVLFVRLQRESCFRTGSRKRALQGEEQMPGTHIAERDVALRQNEALISWRAAQCVLAGGQLMTQYVAFPDGSTGYTLQAIPEASVIEIILWDATRSS